jgi:hypothetical protein
MSGPAAADVRLVAERLSARKTVNHAVALREIALGGPFRRPIALGAALCGAEGASALPEPEAGLFPPEATCANCAMHIRYEGLAVAPPSDSNGAGYG